MFNTYIKSLKTFKVSEITESTYRNKLQDLLEAIAKEVNSKIKIIHEPKREGKFGSPDYKILIADNIVGYVENKPIGEDLDNVLKSEQIKKYKSLSNNLIITNYIEFIWLRYGNVIKRENLSYLTDFENKRINIDSNKAKAVKNLIVNFFSQAPRGISNSKKLAEALSVRARLLKDFLYDELNRQQKEHKEGKLYGLFQTFKKYVFNELSISEFSDTFAQNLVYSLFLAKLNVGKQEVNLNNAKILMPKTFELIKELIYFLDELNEPEYKDTKWIIEETISVVNSINLESIEDELSFNKTIIFEGDIPIKDPYIYFYEDFLGYYDKNLKKSKGVYYTPPPIVNFITNTIDSLIKKNFDIKEGFLSNKEVTVLDFASGTGTFLLEIFKNILKKLPKNTGKKDLIIKEHLLKNFYGFEYLISPYTISHLKLSQFLESTGYKLKDNERLQIFLTDTLTPSELKLNIPLLPALTNETREAQKIKDKQILVITGNPPYNLKSKNNSKWILNLLNDYKPEGERKINIEDDYIKFIRFAHYKLNQVKNGIIGIITNNSFLDGITHRKMRSELIKEFNEIYILNLHGNIRQSEKTPSGKIDENVFDKIQQGVSISFFIKKEVKSEKCDVYYKDLWGSRKYKYSYLYNNLFNKENSELLNIEKFNSEFSRTKWGDRFKEDLNFFIPINLNNIFEYGEFWSLNDIFINKNSGIQTKRDKFTIYFNSKELRDTLKDLKQLSVSEIREKYNCHNSSGWSLEKAIKVLEKTNFEYKNIKKIDYRPLDIRFTYYTEEQGFLGRTRYSIMKYFTKKNIGLSYSRLWNEDKEWSGAFVGKNLFDIHFTGGQSYIAPLYVYKDEEDKLFQYADNLNENFKDEINKLCDQELSPEEILGYIYSILYCSTYRAKYKDYLRIDFPRIPLINNVKILKKLIRIGQDLINYHLIEGKVKSDIGNFKKIGENKKEFLVEEIKLANGKLYINKNQFFDSVSEEIFNYQIGGYYLIDKYLKYRMGRYLDLGEINNIENIINIIAYTIDSVKAINRLAREYI